MNKIELYRAYAADCRAVAAQMTSPEERQQTLAIAAQWDSMADNAEAEARRAASPDGSEDDR